jgi:hypothetical protein
MDLLLFGGNSVELVAHVLDLFGLCMVDVSLSRNLLMALLNFFLSSLVLLSHFALCLLGLGELDFNITKGTL